VNDALREFVHSPDRYTQIPSDVHRFADERVCVLQGNTWAAVSGVRVNPQDVTRLLAEVRERVAPEKSVTWWLDPDTRPGDLHEQLVGLGLTEPRDRGSVLHGLACVTEPPPGPSEIDVRRVETFEDHLVGTEVAWEAFDTPTDRREAQRPHLESEFEAARAAEAPVTFVAFVDGQPAGVGRSVYSDRGVFIIAGGVREWARGRGVYKALVRARWDDAVARGTPALITEALPDTSYPILKRVGFVEVCTIRRLEDVR
jgi:hypothetical protein